MKLSTRDIMNVRTADYIKVEPFLDIEKFKTDGFIRKALRNARLTKFTTANPASIYPIAVTEFYGNMNREARTTSISSRKVLEDGTEIMGRNDINLEDFASTLGLRNSGRTVESAGSGKSSTEFYRFSSDPEKAFNQKKSSTGDLQDVFKTMIDLVSKVILSHIGNISTITGTKLLVMAALCDEVEGVKYNWADFIIRQWLEVSREIEATDSSRMFKMGPKLRYGSKISYGLELGTIQFDDRFAVKARTQPLFTTSVDKPTSQVSIRPIEAPEEMVERRQERKETPKEKKEAEKEKGDRSKRREKRHASDVALPVAPIYKRLRRGTRPEKQVDPSLRSVKTPRAENPVSGSIAAQAGDSESEAIESEEVVTILKD